MFAVKLHLHRSVMNALEILSAAITIEPKILVASPSGQLGRHSTGKRVLFQLTIKMWIVF